MLARWFAIPLWARVLGGLVLGLLVGLLIPDPQIANTWLKPVGDLFIKAIKMLVVPLIFVSLVAGVSSLPDLSRVGKLGAKTLGFYFGSMALAVSLGLVAGNIVKPGVGAPISAGAQASAPAGTLSVKDLILGLVPDNPVAAMANGDILPVIVFSLLLGLAITATGERAQPLRAVFEAAEPVIARLVVWVIELAPFGVFALMAWVGANFGLGVLLPLGKLIATLYVTCILHLLILSLIMVGGLARLSPLKFFRHASEPMLFAFTTTTSSGTLPVTMRAAETKIGISKPVSSFALPLGATMNMDGLAIYLGIIAVFTAQAIGVDLTMGQYVAIIFASTLGAVGAAGIPSGGLLLMPLVLTTAGLPLEVIALVAGIDRILDMMRTATNVGGDLICATLVAHTEGELDRSVFGAQHSPEAAAPAG